MIVMINVARNLLKKMNFGYYIISYKYFFPSVVSGQSDALEPSGLMSPCSTVRSLTKELQHSLDLASATSGDKVVTAQVSEVSVPSLSNASRYCCAQMSVLF